MGFADAARPSFSALVQAGSVRTVVGANLAGYGFAGLKHTLNDSHAAKLTGLGLVGAWPDFAGHTVGGGGKIAGYAIGGEGVCLDETTIADVCMAALYLHAGNGLAAMGASKSYAYRRLPMGKSLKNSR